MKANRWLLLWLAGVLAIGGTAAWYLFTPGTVPVGQPALGSHEDFKRRFAAGVDRTRIVLTLRSTIPGDVAAAARLQETLAERAASPLDVHAIWIPSAGGEWAPPSSETLAILNDPRVKQYWDPAKALRGQLPEFQVLVYSRGASLSTPALRFADFQTGQSKIRDFISEIPTSGTQR